MTVDPNLWFVDSNVLLYRYDYTQPSRQIASNRWLDALGEAAVARLSWQVLNEFYENATRKMGMPRHLVRDLAMLYAEWGPAPFSLELMKRAWHWTDRAQLRYWDALILASAEILRCRYLLSEDFQHGRTYGAVRVVNPFSAAPEEML